MTMLNDERLAHVLHDWWWNQPLAEEEEGYDEEAVAMADMRSLLAHLDESGYMVVPKGATSQSAVPDTTEPAAQRDIRPESDG